MKRQPKPMPRRERGFERAGKLLKPHIAKAGGKRGFEVARILTHWAEIVGEEAALASSPVKINYVNKEFGATLTLLTTGAQAPMLQAELPRIRERVNACYGYNAVSRIRITQTSPSGLADPLGARDAQVAPVRPRPNPSIRDAARESVSHVADSGLRQALEALGESVMARSRLSGEETE